MEIGEFASTDIDAIVNRLWGLELRYENYCRQHNKIFNSEILLGPKLIILKCYIKTII